MRKFEHRLPRSVLFYSHMEAHLRKLALELIENPFATISSEQAIFNLLETDNIRITSSSGGGVDAIAYHLIAGSCKLTITQGYCNLHTSTGYQTYLTATKFMGLGGVLGQRLLQAGEKYVESFVVEVRNELKDLETTHNE